MNDVGMTHRRVLPFLKRIFIKEHLFIKHKPSSYSVENPLSPRKFPKSIRIQALQTRRDLSDITKNLIYSLKHLSVQTNMADDMEYSMNTKPPDSVRGMTKLDREAFKQTTHIPCMKVPTGNIQQVTKRLKKSILKIQGVRPISELPDSDPDKITHKLFLFEPDALPSLDSLSTEDKDYLEMYGVNLDSFRQYEITLNYENWR